MSIRDTSHVQKMGDSDLLRYLAKTDRQRCLTVFLIKHIPVMVALLILGTYILIDYNMVVFFKNESTFGFFLLVLLPFAGLLLIIQICIWGYLFFKCLFKKR